MGLKIYNTLNRKKQEFIPRNKEVNMYVCGPTVYNYISIGNARPIVVFNMVNNYLKYLGFKVNYVQNVTDIEDKIIDKAKQEDVDFRAITRRYINAFMEDLKNLKISQFKEMPLATEMVPEIIKIIQKIIDTGYGYVINGNVYFDVSKFKGYGKLSGQKIEEMQSQETEEGEIHKKRNPIDFALWKKAKQGEPSWDSPWGQGRPGWHIECSAMSTSILDRSIDIHGGGLDLVFPHHENEITQSEAAYPGKEFVRYWMHNGMIEVKESKMSKSDGLKENWILKNLLKKYNHNVLKMYMLSTHYRSPLEFSMDKLEGSKKSLERIVNSLRNIMFLLKESEKEKQNLEKGSNTSKKIMELVTDSKENFLKAMDDDFNSAQAIGYLFDFVKEINMIIQKPSFRMNAEIRDGLSYAYKQILELSAILGFDLRDEIKAKKEKKEIGSAEIEELIVKRNEARKNKDFEEADKIRNYLMEKGIELEDRKEGTIWKVRQ